MRHRSGFSRLSRERVGQEFLKLAVARHAARVMEEAESHGLIEAFAGFPGEWRGFALYRRRAALRGEEPLPIVAIGTLFPQVSPSELAWSFRLSKWEESLLASLREARALAREGASARLITYRHPEMGPLACWLELPDEDAARAFAAPAPPDFHLRGDDLISAGLLPGPQIGALLAEAEQRWIEVGLPESREIQHDILQGVLATR
jgi:poly(A) polymerase